MSEVTAFKDTTHKDKRAPSCWSGVRFTDGSQCQISVAHKVMIYKGRTMIGGKFYEANEGAIINFLSYWLSKDDIWALSRGRLGLLRSRHTESNDLLHPPLAGMNHPLLIIYTNLALQHDSLDDFKETLS